MRGLNLRGLKCPTAYGKMAGWQMDVCWPWRSLAKFGSVAWRGFQVAGKFPILKVGGLALVGGAHVVSPLIIIISIDSKRVKLLIFKTKKTEKPQP